MSCTLLKFRLCVILIVLLHGSANGIALTADQLKEGRVLVSRVFQNKGRVDQAFWDGLPPEKRDLVLGELRWTIENRRQHSGGQEDFRDGGPALHLAMLGDQTGRTLTVQGYLMRPYERSDSILLLNDPRVISMVGETLFTGGELIQADSDLIFAADREVVRKDILRLLVQTHAFTEAVETWAGRMGPEKGIDPSGTELLKVWFKENEAALTAEDFKAVKPGAERASEPADSASAVSSVKFNATSPLDSRHTTHEPNQFLKTAPPNRGSYAWYVVAAIALTSIAAFGWAFGLLRKR